MNYREGPVRDTVGNLTIGKRVKLYERVRKQLNSRSDSGHDARVRIGDKIVEVTPNYANENLNPGTAAGAIVAAIESLAGTYVPIAGDTEVTSVEMQEDGAVYQVNVDSVFEQEGKFKAMMESGQGVTSIITDSFDVGEPETFNKKPARTTWQYEVKVRTDTQGEQRDLGLGILF